MVGSTSGASADPDINFPIISGESTRIINNTEYDLVCHLPMDMRDLKSNLIRVA